MKLSVNQLRLELADIQSSHLMLHTFFWGDFARAVNEETINYPLMASYYPSASILDNQTSIPITIVLADKIYTDYSNLNDVESDTLQYCRHIFNIMNKSKRWQLLGRVESCSVTKFIESQADICAGHIMTVNFMLRDSNSICDLPMSGYDFDQVIGSSCLPVQIYRNGVLVDTVESGGVYSYTTDAFTYTIKNTALTTLYSGNVTANLDVTIQDSTVSNSDSTYSSDIVAEGSLTLPDITIDIDNTLGTTLNTVTVPSVQNTAVTAPDATININKTGGGLINSQNIPSGTTANYSVADNAITVNGANNFTIDATDPLNIVLSDGTSTVTPTSVTPNAGLNKVDIVLTPSATIPVGAKLMKTGQTTSYRTGDDGDLEAGRATSFFVLASNNPFGNTNRFTDELGGQTYTNNIVIDWSTYDGSTVLGYRRTQNGVDITWNNAIDGALATSIGTFTSGWRLPNRNEFSNLWNGESTLGYNYSPLNLNTPGLECWTGNSLTAATTLAWFNNTTYGQEGYKAKTTTTNSRYIPCRTFTVTGTTLS